MNTNKLKANADKHQKADNKRRSVSKEIKQYADAVQGIQMRREEEYKSVI